MKIQKKHTCIFSFCCGLILVFFSFSSCRQNSDTTPVLGNMDSTAIAADTALQLGLESSYEFHKTIVVHKNLAYDITAYGGPASFGEFAIMKRGADNITDTVIKETRNGKITDVTFENGELSITIQKPTDSVSINIFRYSVNDDKIQPIK